MAKLRTNANAYSWGTELIWGTLKNPVPAFALRVDDTRRSLSCCVDGAGERTAREARLSHDVVFLGDAANDA